MPRNIGISYVGLGFETKKKAIAAKKKAISEGFKGVKIIPFISYKSKRPSHYDVTYERVNPLIKRVKKYKKKTVITYYRRTPKGLKRISSDTIYR